MMTKKSLRNSENALLRKVDRAVIKEIPKEIVKVNPAPKKMDLFKRRR